MKRMLTFLLSAVFLLTAAVPSVLAQEEKGKTPARSSDPVQGVDKTITVGEEYALKEEEGVSVFTFKPTKSGNYRFYSFDLELGDPMGEVYDAEDDYLIRTNDDSDFEEGTYNFDIRLWLEKGKTYELKTFDRFEGYGQYKIRLEALDQVKVSLTTKKGTFQDEKTTISYTACPGEKVRDLPAPFSEEDYEYGDDFLGYSTSADADSSDLISRETVLSNGDKLYAVWGDSIPVTFHSGGGEFEYEDEDLWETVSENYTYRVTWNDPISNAFIPTPAKPGYAFIGWQEEEMSEPEPCNPLHYNITEDCDFYAIWEPIGDKDDVEGVMKLGKPVDVSYGKNQFSFTPAKTGTYLFYSFNNLEKCDPYVEIYDDKGECIHTDDDGGLGRNFRFVNELKAGKTYYLVAVACDRMPANYQIVVKKPKKVTLQANGGYYSGGETDDDEGEVDILTEIEDWIADSDDLACMTLPSNLDNRQVVAGWSKTEGSTKVDVTPDTKIKDGDTFYAVWRKWNEKERIEPAKVTGIKTKTYTGKQIKQAIEVSLIGVKLTEGKDYTVKYKNNTKAGIATVTITGKGNYAGTIKKTFQIKPAKTKITSLKNTAKKTVTVKWKKAKSGTGYQIQYGLKKNFKGAKKITVSKLKTTAKTIKKLKKGKTYYVRVRVYQKTASGNLYSKWSAKKKVKIKK